MKICFSMDPMVKIDAVKDACAAAKANGCECICVPQWFVSTAADELASADTSVATIVGLPGGTTSPYSKFAEAKQAVANGADLVIFPVNMALCKKGDIDAAKGDLASALVACSTVNARKRNVKSAALVDAADVDDAQLKKIVEFCLASGVCLVLVAHNEKAAADLKAEFDAVEAF